MTHTDVLTALTDARLYPQPEQVDALTALINTGQTTIERAIEDMRELERVKALKEAGK